MYASAEYVVYGGHGEPLGLMNYGGQYYYSDDPPWLTPLDLAYTIYRAKRRSRLRVVRAAGVSDEVYEEAMANDRARVYRR